MLALFVYSNLKTGTMRKIMAGIALQVLFVSGCSKSEDETMSINLTKESIVFLPENPRPSDQIKVVILDDCIWSVLESYNHQLKEIELIKKFDSSQKLPCVYQNDTILIGTFSRGEYNFTFKLHDTSPKAKKPYPVSFTIPLVVQ